MSLSAGDRLGPYEIVDLLGQGGMGEVYRARDPRLGRDVAVKVLRSDVAVDADRRARFLQEAKAVSALSHPNIVTVYDIGAEGDTAYLVLELIDGRPLDAMLTRGGLRVPDVLRIAAQVADACARAHAAGIIHRDLKPANVMVQPDGRVKVLDFGLAKLVDTSDVPEGEDSATRTAHGMVMGTAAYMSPEQAEGKPLDFRTDIFSFGAVLYELCTGKRPFQGDSQASVLAEVLRQDPKSPEELRSDLPPELVRLVMRCLRKDPARRAQSMADLKVALEELKEEIDSGKIRAVPSAVGSSGGNGKYMWAAVGAAVMAVAALVAWRNAGTTAAPTAITLQPMPLTSYPGSETWPSFSPDGNQVAFVWNGEHADNWDIYVKMIGSGMPLRLTSDPRREISPQWSPDGRNIAFVRVLDRELLGIFVVPPLGGPERKILELHTRVVLEYILTDITWTPDSKFLFLSGSTTAGEPNHLMRLNVDTGELKTLVPVDAASDGYLALDISPDGHTLAAILLGPGGRSVKLMSLSPTFDITGTKSLTVQGNPNYLQWTADSRDLLYIPTVNNPLPLYRVSVATGESTPLPWTGPGAFYPAVAPSGNRLVFARDSRDTNIWRIALDDHAAKPELLAGSSSFREVAPQYSPDGKRLAFYSSRGGSIQVWTSETDGSRAVQLTSMDPMATTGTPRWSPDGKRLSFDSNAGGVYQIYVIGADGGQPRALTTGSSNNFVSAWSPDGRWIYFSSNRGGQSEVWRVPPEGGEPEPVTHTGGQAPMFSADGRWLYFTKRDGADGIWRMPAGGGEEEQLVKVVNRYSFAVTADGIYYVPPALPDRSTSVSFRNFKTGATSEILKITKPTDLGVAVSPDGKQLLYTQIDYLGVDLMLVEGFR